MALVAAARAGLVGATVVLSSGPSRSWRPTGRRASLLGPLHQAGLRRLFAALTGTGFTLGALTVWAISAADRQHASWLADTVPAAQLRCAAAAFAASWVPLLTDPALWAAVAAVLVPGAVLTPLITSAFLTTPDMVTAAYAWLIAAVGTGQAAGTALAGLTTTHSMHTTAALPAAGAAFTAVVLIASPNRMNPTPQPTHLKENRLGSPYDLDC